MVLFVVFFFFKQKTAYEMRISDWSSDVCSSDLFAIERRGVDAVDIDRDRVGGGDVHGDLPPQRGKLLRVAGRFQGDQHADLAQPRRHRVVHVAGDQIGRASCRERVGQYV